jgi:hypothetical protein
MNVLSGPLFMVLVGQVMLAMLRVFFMHEIICIVHMFLLSARVLMAVIVKVVPTMDMLVTVQPVSMMEILLISR